jgi:hypothetical protein
MKLGIVAIFKNEFPFILEWIAYHQLIGVSNFYIADNISDDGSSQLLEALDSLGIIKRVHFPRLGEGGPQVPAYNKILTEFGHEVDLMAFIDADEFLVFPDDKSGTELLKKIIDDDKISAIGLNWNIFGSSNLKFSPNGLIIEEYKYSSEKDFDNNRHIKTIVKPDRIQTMNIHECILKSGRYVDSNLQDIEFDETGAKTKFVNHNNIYLNHYVVKSRVDHFINKAKKGSAAGKSNRIKGEAYFKFHDKNQLIPNNLNKHYEAVKNKISHLKYAIENKSHFMSFSSGHVHVINDYEISGWVTTDLDIPTKVKILIDNEEHIVDINLKRSDVFDKGLTNNIVCGFNKKLNKPISKDAIIQVFLYGSMSELTLSIIQK